MRKTIHKKIITMGEHTGLSRVLNKRPRMKVHNKDIILVCKSVMFCCHKDEDAFFWWLKRIECIHNFKGVGDELHLYLVDRPLYDEDLDDLIGFFYRYKIDMKQLAQFLTAEKRMVL